MEIDKNEHNVAGIAVSSLSRRSSIIRTLTANDVIVWGSDAFISVALALFVVSFIEGATIFNVGIALMIHRVVGAISAIPIGRWFDRHQGYFDEAWGLTLACFGSGVLYIILSFSTTIWHLYFAMFGLGFFAMLNLASWRILFYGSINQEQLGQTIGVYQTMFSLGIGLFLAIGGFTGERFGYDKVLLYGGLLMIAGSLLPLMLRSYLPAK